MEPTCFITATVQPEQKVLGIRQLSRKALAALLLVTWVFVAALATSPSLHQFFHHDAANHDHSCVVTLLQQGGVLAATGAPLVAALVLFFSFSLPPVPLVRFPSLDRRLGFGRAPPRSFSLR